MKKIKEQRFSIGREERSTILIANFIDGYTSDFIFDLPTSFRDALDIQLTQRVIFGKKENIYTQGRNFSFDQGDVIYDSKKLYELPWDDALHHSKICIQIIKANSASTEVAEVYKNIDSPVSYFVNDEENNIIEYDKMIINKYVYNPGYVKFRIYKPKIGISKLEIESTYECTQENFVVLLQTGVLRTLNNETIKLI